MGQMSLQEFRSGVSHALQKGVGNEMLDLFINMAYFDVMTREEHEQLRVCARLSTVVGQEGYDIPEGLLGIDAIIDHSNRRILLYADAANFKQISESRNSYPRYWSRMGSRFLLTPKPSGVFSLEAIYYREGAKLDQDEDTSILPSTFDPAIFMLAVHFAKATINGMGDESDRWFVRAERYLQSRKLDRDFSSGTLAAPLTIAGSLEDLTSFRGVY